MFRPAGNGRSSARNSALLRQWVQQVAMSLEAWNSAPHRHHTILRRRRQRADLLVKRTAGKYPAAHMDSRPACREAHRLQPPNTARHSLKAVEKNRRNQRRRQAHNKLN
jgi:hypothetical protein